jgi:hypothetical protein
LKNFTVPMVIAFSTFLATYVMAFRTRYPNCRTSARDVPDW